MLEIMYVRCTHCGYDNSPEYRFCGMCGASLSRPPAVEPVPAKEARPAPRKDNGHTEPVHGPSFLGLADDAADPKVEFHYLYEDEQPKSHVGLILLLFIAIGVAGFAGWQWKHNGFPFNRMGGGGQQASASPSEVAPASTSDQQTHIDKPMTGAGDVLPTQPDQNAQNQTPGKPTETDIPPANGAAPQNSAAQQNQAPQQNAAATPSKNDNSANKQNAASPDENATEEANATPPPGVAKASKVAKEPARTREPKPTPSHPAGAAAAGTSPDADLELSGEKFLYGNGVPQNCARAESSLRTAAMHGNSKAETVLGTMYATGHCVGRDLPSAYRWFARALHEEPQNSRISADLQVLWRQMTPQEKQLATNRGQ
jgi:hypothetical protein